MLALFRGMEIELFYNMMKKQKLIISGETTIVTIELINAAALLR